MGGGVTVVELLAASRGRVQGEILGEKTTDGWGPDGGHIDAETVSAAVVWALVAATQCWLSGLGHFAGRVGFAGPARKGLRI
jgi:hypothetical protein